MVVCCRQLQFLSIDGLLACFYTKLLMPAMGAKPLNSKTLVHVATMKYIHRKQARRTGMAGPLGEMFDHGKHTFQYAQEMRLMR
jgi:hypothetical protein